MSTGIGGRNIKVSHKVAMQNVVTMQLKDCVLFVILPNKKNHQFIRLL